jgi:hypothetical protein
MKINSVREQKEFGEAFVADLGDFIRESYKKAELIGLSKAAAKEVIKTTFVILGKR